MFGYHGSPGHQLPVEGSIKPALFVKQLLTTLEWVFHEQSIQEFQCTDRKHFTFVESMKGLISLTGLSDLLPGSALSCVLERDFLLPPSLRGAKEITHMCVHMCGFTHLLPLTVKKQDLREQCASCCSLLSPSSE